MSWDRLDRYQNSTVVSNSVLLLTIAAIDDCFENYGFVFDCSEEEALRSCGNKGLEGGVEWCGYL